MIDQRIKETQHIQLPILLNFEETMRNNEKSTWNCPDPQKTTGQSIGQRSCRCPFLISCFYADMTPNRRTSLWFILEFLAHVLAVPSLTKQHWHIITPFNLQSRWALWRGLYKQNTNNSKISVPPTWHLELHNLFHQHIQTKQTSKSPQNH